MVWKLPSGTLPESYPTWSNIATARSVTGVPQGSILDHLLLFLICATGTSSVAHFADDTKSYQAIKDARDGEYLQRDVNSSQETSELIKWQNIFANLLHSKIFINAGMFGYWVNFSCTHWSFLNTYADKKCIWVYARGGNICRNKWICTHVSASNFRSWDTMIHIGFHTLSFCIKWSKFIQLVDWLMKSLGEVLEEMRSQPLNCWCDHAEMYWCHLNCLVPGAAK